MVFKSDPEGAEILVDGKFLGTTPSTVQLSPGSHLISFGKTGYQPWQRELMTTPGGIVTVSVEFQKKEGGSGIEARINREIPH